MLMPEAPGNTIKDTMSESEEGNAPLISLRQLQLVNIGIQCAKDKGGFDMAKFARMGGYKNTAVASTTWSRVRRHLQKIAPVEDPGPSADADGKKRKHDEDGDGEEGVSVKKRGKVVKAVGSDDELASEGVKGKKGKRGAARRGITPDRDSQEEARNCITVKGSDGEDGPVVGKKNAAKRVASKARSDISGKRKNKGIAASEKIVENGVGDNGGSSHADTSTKMGEPEKGGADAAAFKVDEAEDSDTADEDVIVAKGGKDLCVKVDEPQESPGPLEFSPAGECSKPKGTKAGGVDTERAKGAAAGEFKDSAEKDPSCIEAIPIEGAGNTKKSKPTKAAKGSGVGFKKSKGKLAAESVLAEAGSVKKSGRVKTAKTLKGDVKPKVEDKSAGYTEASLVLDVEKAVVNSDEDTRLAKDGVADTSKTDGSAPVKRSRQAKRAKKGSASSSGAGKAGVEGTHTAKEADQLGVKYTANDTQGAGVIPDSQDSA